MENKANYALIGIFVLVAIAALMGFFVWLSGAQLNQQYDFYEVGFEGGVNGLNRGSEVRFNGLPVGEVTSLKYDENDPNLVLANIQVTENTPIDTEAKAKLAPLGLTGLNYIEITPGTSENPVMLDDIPGRVKRIEGEASAVDELLTGGGDVVLAASSALTRANMLLSDDNLATFSKILTNIEAITASVDLSELDAIKLNDLMDSLTNAADAITATAQSIEDTSETVERVVDEDFVALLTNAKATLSTVDGTLGSFNTAAGGIDELTVDIRDAVNRLSNSGLTDIEETIDVILSLVTTLDRIADNLEQSPAQFIVGADRDEVVLPQ